MNIENLKNNIKQIMNIDSPTGYTYNAVNYLEKFCIDLGYSTKITQKGNLIVSIEGEDSERCIGICAHLDTLGLMVRSIKSDGKLAITTLGGINMNTIDGEYCKIYTRDQKVFTGTVLSTSPSSHVYPDANSIKRDCEHMEVKIDEIVNSKQDVEKLGIMSGDFIAIDTKTEITPSGFIKSRFLDDKLSVAILMTLLQELKDVKLAQKTYFIFTVYEEVGHGNTYIPSDITELLGVDMGCIGLDLNCSEYDVSICAKDSSGPYDYNMVSKLIELAKQQNLNYAVDIYPMYGSDVSSALRAGNNIKGALIGPGVAASHGMERSHIKACEATYALIKAYLG